MVGIEQYFRNLFLSHQPLVDYLNKDKPVDELPVLTDIYIDHLPSFTDGFDEHLPLILIRNKECSDSFFYDDEPHAYDVLISIGIGAKNYESLSDISDLVKGLMLGEDFFITESDSFSDSVENMLGLLITFHNSIFMGLHNN